MKYLKMLGLAAIAAAALTAFLGAGSASATVLCKVTESPCNSLATSLDATLSGTAKLEAGTTVLDECTGGTVGGTVSEQGATVTAKGSVATTGLTWSGCTKTTNTLKGGTLEVHSIAGTDNGTVTATGFEVTVNSIFGTCVFGFGATAKDLGVLKGGTPATLEISAEVPRISGACPSTATWTANYKVTEPTSLFVLAS